MNLNMMSILIFLMGIITVMALNIDPDSASVAMKHLNITLAPNAMDTLHAHGLWAPSTAGISGAEPMFDDSFNATLEEKKFEESGLDINSLVHIDVNNGNTKTVTDIANVDVCAPYPDCCKQCHTCEEACLAGIIILLIPWLICEGACRAQGYCKDRGCD